MITLPHSQANGDTSEGKQAQGRDSESHTGKSQKNHELDTLSDLRAQLESTEMDFYTLAARRERLRQLIKTEELARHPQHSQNTLSEGSSQQIVEYFSTLPCRNDQNDYSSPYTS
jgi:hypothetical protein